LKEKAVLVKKIEIAAVGICCANHATTLSAKVSTNFADERQSLGWCGSLAD
jgi:hypothetical protein